jgi:5-methylcytosine-specific restriction endonuclease McrA
MRNLAKLEKPEILEQNEAAWLAAFLADKKSPTNRYRYRHTEIKNRLRSETHNKCVYCESKIGHNTPGDVEHKMPTNGKEHLHFSWENLTLACTECNRRKSDYSNDDVPFVDPYTDNVEQWLVHHGPIVTWQVGNKRAEISVRMLELASTKRLALIQTKLEKIQDVMDIIERFHAEADPTLKALLRKRLEEMSQVPGEYSAMVESICVGCGV